MKLKAEHFQVYDLVSLFWLCKWNTTHKIPGTSAVYWVAWFVKSGMYQTAIKRKRKDVYWYKFNIKIVNMSCVLTLLDILSIHYIGN